jgi:glycosyltransferase involved in cell wall biosynthesis
MIVVSIGGISKEHNPSMDYNDVGLWNAGVYDELEHEDTISHLLVFDWFGYSAALKHSEATGSKVIGFVGLLASGRGTYAPFTDKNKLRVLVNNEQAYLIGCYSLIAFTSSSASEVKKLVKTPVDVIHLGVDIPAVVNTPESGICISIGRISRDRCYELLIRSVAEMPWLTTVKICGSGKDNDYGTYLANVAKRLEIADKVEIVNVESDKLSAIYKVGEFSVCPSLYDPYGYSCLDSMAYGVPVLGRGISYSDFISHNTNGLIFHSKQDLEEGIDTLHNSKTLKESIIGHARETIQQFHTVSKYVNNVDQFLKTI